MAVCFALEKDSAPSKLIFNRRVALKDNWVTQAPNT
jgi:hypothetical protein